MVRDKKVQTPHSQASSSMNNQRSECMLNDDKEILHSVTGVILTDKDKEDLREVSLKQEGSLEGYIGDTSVICGYMCCSSVSCNYYAK